MCCNTEISLGFQLTQFSMESEEGLLKDATGRRLLAVNAGEQKRLEKIQRYIDKKRREKERMLTRAQREAVEKFYEASGKGSNDFMFIERRSEGHSRLKAVMSDVTQNHCIVSKENTREAKEKTTRKQKLALQENSSKNLLPGLELTVFSLKAARSFQRTRARSRSWSNPSDTDLKLEEKQDEKTQTEGQLEDKEIKQDFVNCDKVEEKREKPLSAILPPLVLPPLHRHRRTSLQEQTKNMYKIGGDFNNNRGKSLKEHCEELSDVYEFTNQEKTFEI